MYDNGQFVFILQNNGITVTCTIFGSTFPSVEKFSFPLFSVFSVKLQEI